ncbi:MAG TPA: hydantoinase/oxoprolinase family protein [Burkholderiales bacterium]|jgi:N-methylhydantoinase A|nr:hydantoinase/oxoprolinase family protein [Burkholderiales bacterium]
MTSPARTRIAADIGGTFTDVAAFDEKRGLLMLGKTLTTHHRLISGILDGMHKAGVTIEEANLFLHGSTIAINTMLERTGAKAALVTTRGFRDIYEIGRINRPDSFNLRHRKHSPLIERDLRFEVTERLKADGSVYQALQMAELETIAAELERLKIEAVAVLFLHSYRNPVHEHAARDYLRQRLPGVFISASCDLVQEYREYERTSTVAANAYIGPRVDNYLGEIEQEMKRGQFGGKFLVVQSTGGLYSLNEARQDCVRMMESGPAAGVIGTQALCHVLGIDNAIAFDMGGTTAKAGVVREGTALVTGSVMIGGYLTGLPLLTPMIDIHEVGTGGGSIASVSVSGALRVGPQSAGASPGPVCYGLGGTEPTVTDANLVLGRLDPKRFLGGEMLLDKAAATAALKEKIAVPLGLSVTDAALGILRIASASMSHAVKGVTTDRGLDPGAFPTLFAYGGAGPLHASMVARELRMPQVIIPRAPGHFSAFGMLLSDFRRDLVRSQFTSLNAVDMVQLETWFAELEQQGLVALTGADLNTRKIIIGRALDMRYVGQEHAVTVDVPLSAFKRGDKVALKRAFDTLHEERYGRGSPNEQAEIVSIRSTVTGVMKKPTLEKIARGSAKPRKEALTGTRKVYFEGKGWAQAAVYQRDTLLAGNAITGPALIEEHATTTVLQPGDSLRVEPYGNLQIAVGKK